MTAPLAKLPPRPHEPPPSLAPVPPPPAPPPGEPAVLVARAEATRAQRLALLAGLAVVFGVALELFAAVLLPFVAAAGIAYFLDPAASRLTRAGLPRGAAALTLILALITACLLFALLLYPLIISQIGLLIGRLPDYVTDLRAFAADVIEHLQQRLGHDYVDEKLRDLVSGQAGAMLTFLAGALRGVIGSGFALFNVLTLVVVTPVVAFYLLRDWPRVVARVDGWLPRRYAGVLRAQGREVDRILSAWLRGQALCCILLALFYATALTGVGLDLGLIVGLSAGVLSFIPYVGSIFGAVTSIGLAFAQFPTWTGVAMVAGVFVVGQILEGYVIYPRFLGDRVELHAVWVIFALFAGGAAFGFVGVLLAVPIAATIGVLCRFWLRRYMRSSLYLDPPGPAPTPVEPRIARHRSRPVWRVGREPVFCEMAPVGRGSDPVPETVRFRPLFDDRRCSMTRGERQLALPFEHVPSYGPDFLEAGSNAEAVAWLARPANWPQGRLTLWGSPGSGKTHLLHLWAARHRATLLAGPGLALAPVAGPLAIDDADAAPPEPLLHMLNAAAEAGRAVLLAARTPPGRWHVPLADLSSRLRAITAVEIGDPEDTLLRALLARLLADRQLAIPEPVQGWMLLRLPRTAAAIREAARRLDEAGLRAGAQPVWTLARAVVAQFGAASLAQAGDSFATGEVL